MISRQIFFNFLSILLCALCLLSFKAVALDETPRPILGELDLQGWDFKANEPIPLQGEWGFYWNQLIPPENIGFQDNAIIFREFDQLWNKRLDDEPVLDRFGYATYYLKIKLDKDAPGLAVSIPDFYSAYSLYFNGELISKNGEIGTTKESYEPQWLHKIVDLPKAEEGNIDLVLHISNFHHSKGGASRHIILGEKEEIHKLYDREAATDLIMTGCLIMTAFFFLGLFWFGKQEMQLLFFGLYSLMYSYRIFGFGIYTFHTLFPDVPWIITLRLEYLTLFLSSLFFACYTRELYKEETSIIFVRFASILSIVFSVIAVFFPPSIFTLLVGPFFIVLLLGFIYIIYTYVLAVYNKRTGSILSLLGTSIVMIVFGFNILVYFGVTPEHKLFTYLGYFTFFFIQSIILFNLHTTKLNAARTRAETISNSKTEFLSTISHEMRTPLNAVIGLSKYLINDNPKKEHLSDLKSLKHSADSLNFLINDVLDYSKIEAGQIVFDYTDVNIQDLIENQIRSLEPRATEKGIKLSYIMDKDIPKMIVCDGFRLSQVLTNLIGNAIKFTRKGSVKLIITNTQITQENVSLKFSVEDTGIGIAPKNFETIFDNYIQASLSISKEFGGTGLGLAITKKILELQNTEIHVQSELGKGSQFFFTQEFEICEVQESIQDKVYEEMQGFEGKIILLVEDNPVNIMIEKKFLARWKISVDVAENGLIAIQKAKEKQYDLILMDLRMPEMDGYEATEELRRIGIKIPIIAVTASGITKVGEKIFNAGMNDFIKKPFDPEEMYAKIKKYLSMPLEPKQPGSNKAPDS